MSGKLKVKGDVMKATKMEPILKKAQTKAKLWITPDTQNLSLSFRTKDFEGINADEIGRVYSVLFSLWSPAAYRNPEYVMNANSLALP